MLFSVLLTAYMLQAVLGQGCWHNSQEVQLLYPEYKTKLQTLAVALLLLLPLSEFIICILEFWLLPLIMLARILQYFVTGSVVEHYCCPCCQYRPAFYLCACWCDSISYTFIYDCIDFLILTWKTYFKCLNRIQKWKTLCMWWRLRLAYYWWMHLNSLSISSLLSD